MDSITPNESVPQPKPGFLWSMLSMRCPRCRRGAMFSQPNPWNLRQMMKMPSACPVCGQLFELEVGFWYGTGYVSYLITVLFSVLSFVVWFLTIGFSLTDNRVAWWICINAILMLLLQPWFMRISRVVYLYFFVHYDPYYRERLSEGFDYNSDSYFKK